MTKTGQHILLTGPPGCGKTTVVRHVADQLSDLRLAGFFTRELRHGVQRVGFEAIGLSGQTARLARGSSKSRLRVGKYGVELPGFEKLLRAELEARNEAVDLYVVDEIGKMECFSDLFMETIRQILDGDVPLLGTIALKGGGFIGEVKQRDDVELITVSPENRDSLPGDLAARFRSC